MKMYEEISPRYGNPNPPTQVDLIEQFLTVAGIPAAIFPLDNMITLASPPIVHSFRSVVRSTIPLAKIP